MSALQFVYTPNGDGPCMVFGCSARCRYLPMILGHVMHEEKLCLKHRKEAEEVWIGALDEEVAKDREPVPA